MFHILTIGQVLGIIYAQHIIAGNHGQLTYFKQTAPRRAIGIFENVTMHR
jgi:hypothetical protein